MQLLAMQSFMIKSFKNNRPIFFAILADLSQRFIPALFLLAYVYFLQPSSFGSLFLINMIISLGNVFFSFGLRHGYLHNKNSSSEFEQGFNSLAWILGVLAVALLCLIAPLLSYLLNHPDLTYSIRIASLQLLLINVSLIQFSYLEKHQKYQTIFWIRTASVLLSGVSSFVFIHLGLDYLGIIYGTLLGQLLPIILLFNQKPVWPSWKIGPEWIIHIKEFSGWVTFNDCIAWFYSWIDVLILNLLMGVEFSGLYRVAHQVAGLLFVAPSMGIANYSFNLLSGLKIQINLFEKNLRNLINFSLILFLGIFFFLLKNLPFFEKILPVQWGGLQDSVAILAIVHVLFGLIMLMSYALRASGRALLEAKLSAALIPFFFISSWLSASSGYESFLQVKLFVAILFFGIYILVLNKTKLLYLPSMLMLIWNPGIISLVFFGCAWFLLPNSLDYLTVSLSSIVVIGYFCLMAVLNKSKLS